MTYKSPEQRRKAAREGMRKLRLRRQSITGYNMEERGREKKTNLGAKGITGYNMEGNVIPTAPEPAESSKKTTEGLTASDCQLPSVERNRIRLHKRGIRFISEKNFPAYEELVAAVISIYGKENSGSKEAFEKKEIKCYGRKDKRGRWEWRAYWNNTWKKLVIALPALSVLSEDISANSLQSASEENGQTSCLHETSPKFSADTEKKGKGRAWENFEIAFTTQKCILEKMPSIRTENPHEAVKRHEEDIMIAKEFIEANFNITITGYELLYNPEVDFESEVIRQLAKLLSGGKDYPAEKVEEGRIIIYTDKSPPPAEGEKAKEKGEIRAETVEQAAQSAENMLEIEKILKGDGINAFVEGKINKSLEQIVVAQAMITKNQTIFDANMQSHIHAVRELAEGVKELKEVVKEAALRQGILNRLWRWIYGKIY